MTKRILLIITGVILVWAGSAYGQLPDHLRSSQTNMARLPDKMSPALHQLLSAERQAQRPKHLFTILVRDPVTFSAYLKNFAPALTIQKSDDNYRLFTIRVDDYSTLTSLMQLDNVLFIDDGERKPREEIILKDIDLGLNRIELARAYFPHFRGDGLNVAVKENLFNPDDIDILAQIRGTLPAGEITTHATTVATIIVGRGNLSETSHGLAPEAGLFSTSFYQLFPDELSFFEVNDISVQNHAYGIDLESYYGLEAMAYDQFTRLKPEVLHVFSAGNEGLATPGSGVYANLPGWSNLTGNMKMAKNVLTVGAIDSFGMTSGVASRGPAYDGRIKPELVTMGQRGSSESAAIVSGAALLLQQAYQSRHMGQLPPSSLLKVVMINTADDVHTKGIDFVTGYGSLNLLKALQVILDGGYVEGQIKQDEQITHEIEVPDQVAKLKITLGWPDPPAEPGAAAALVNDLDLTLERDEEEWLPWGLNAAADEDSLNLPAVRKTDHLNNNEQITVDTPAPGKYKIKVKAGNLNGLPQNYYLSYQIDTLSSFYWITPGPGDRISTERPVLLRWQHHFPISGKFKLEYTLDEGNTWMVIDSQIDPKENFIKWNPPPVFSEVQLRMVTAENMFPSGKFVISEKPGISVDYECEDEVRIKWNQIPEAGSYDLLRWNGKDMVHFRNQEDTFLLVDKNLDPSVYFAVQPVHRSGIKGYRSDALDYRLQGSFCYLTSFFGTLKSGIVGLELILSSDFQVGEIIFEKEINDQFLPIYKTDQLRDLILYYEDPNPVQGRNSYRAKIRLLSGVEIVSEVTNVYYAGEKEVLLYPNPVTLPSDVTVLLKNSGVASIAIFNTTGRLVKKFNILNGNSIIPLEGMPAGLYYYKINQDGIDIFAGSFQII